VVLKNSNPKILSINTTTPGKTKFVVNADALPVVAKIQFFHGERVLLRGDTIQRGTPLAVRVVWDTKEIDKIIFDSTYYQPTLQEIENGKYTFEVKPEATTIYKYTIFYLDKTRSDNSHKITVVNKK